MSKLFKDPAVEQQILEKGYVKLPLLSSEQIKKLRSESDQFIKTIPVDYLKGFLSLGRVSEHDARNLSTEIIRKNYIPALSRYLLSDQLDIMSGVHLIKSPGFNGALNIHQDSSMVDELKYLSVYAWTPLQNTHKWNGTLKVIPYSHLLGNIQRTLNVPSPFINFLDALKKFEVPINVKAGEVVFFHSALMHSSAINLTLYKRIAVNCFIKPKEAQFLHYYRDNDTPEKKVEVFEVSPHFYYNEDILKRPDTKSYPFREYQDWVLSSISQEEFYEKSIKILNGKT